MNWNDLTYLLAVMRGGSLTGAARLSGVDKSTVSRRLAALETDLNVALTERAPDGRISLTEAGRSVVHRAETVEDEMRAMAGDLGQMQPLAGRVRLTAVPLLINHLLLPRAHDLKKSHPDLGLDLIAGSRNLSLLDFDADIALRLARPRDGGQGIIAHRVGTMPYGAFAAKGARHDLPWIGYEPRMLHLNHAAAIEQLAVQPGQMRAHLSVNDGETLLHAVLGGLGVSLLPRLIGEGMDGLEPRNVPEKFLPSREIWLMVRRDIRDLARISAVVSWLSDGLKSNP